METPFKSVAWGGITIKVPESWEVARIGMRHLVFEQRGQSIMEIKWQKIKGKFSAKSHLKKLRSAYKKGAIHEWSPPLSWSDTLDSHQVDGFGWKSEEALGRGVILWCAHCRTATLIQFIDQPDKSVSQVRETILKSFRDHRDDGRILWALFDIRALLPEDFAMRSYAFQPGRFQLAFENGSAGLTLYRWAPAAAVLSHRTLSDFAAETFGTSPSELHHLALNSHPTVAWDHSPKPPWFLYRWRSKPHFRQGRIWHVKSKNRILGARLQDKKPLDVRSLDELFAAYETI